MAPLSSSIDNTALLKVLLHAAKYPTSPVGGVLLGTAATSSDGGASLQIFDAIPVCHSWLTLAPVLETALAQVGRPRVVEGAAATRWRRICRSARASRPSATR